MDTSPIRRRHNTVSLQQLTKPLRPRSKRQHGPPILSKIKLGKHLPTIRLRPHPKDQLVAPPPSLTTGLDNIGQCQQKSPCTLSIHARQYGTPRLHHTSTQRHVSNQM
jgi:hypothetical protein